MRKMEEAASESDENVTIKSKAASVDEMRMFENIAMSKACIKSQQRGEGDLSVEQRCTILSEIFQQSPEVFLQRFHPYLCEDDLPCFDHMKDNYEAAFYLKKATRRLAGGKMDVVVKNRRYEALKRLEKEGSYFSDDEMRARDPLMYEQLVGQYLTGEEYSACMKTIDQSDLKFSTILLQFMQDQETKALEKRQQDLEDGAQEEEEEEEEDTDDEEHAVQQKLTDQERNLTRRGAEEDCTMDEDEATTSSSAVRQPTPATAEEKQLLREEYCSYMRERFLSGEDQDFDYTAVDGNEEYDSLAIRGWDEEEKYFDEEEPCDARSGDPLSAGQSDEDTRTGNELVDDYETWTPDDVAME